MKDGHKVIDTRLPALLKSKRALSGIFVGPPAPWLVEMCGHAGFDFVVIDHEHGSATSESMENMLRAARASGVIPIVRTPEADISAVLDLGASGIQVPQVEDAEQASRIVALAKYPPVGSRGAAFSTRAGGFGFFGGAKQSSDANEGTSVIVQVESRKGLANVDAIARVPGIDVIFFGPNDLSFSMGYPGQGHHPEVVQAIVDGIGRTTASGITAGVIAINPAEFKRWAAVGGRYLVTVTAAVISGALRVAADVAE